MTVSRLDKERREADACTEWSQLLAGTSPARDYNSGLRDNLLDVRTKFDRKTWNTGLFAPLRSPYCYQHYCAQIEAGARQ
jgi:hypothetical protein